MHPQILIVDDDESILKLLEMQLKKLGYRTRCESSGAGMRDALKEDEFNTVLMDFHLPDGDGISFIDEVHEAAPELPVIIITAHGSIERAVDAMRRGAYDFASKPVDFNRLSVSVKNAVEWYALKQRVSKLERSKKTGLCGMIGSSSDMQVVYRIIENVAPTKAPVFITGESGTGKEMVAQAVHQLSDRSKNELIDVNCSAIPKDLLESELFGHERNAFTGANERYIGRCERANRSTLFLDEVAEMNVSLQPKLLRFLEEHSFYRVGGKEKIVVDLRLVSATNRDPLDAIRDQKFREDLYYRLNVVHIPIPSLRERPEDIPDLAHHFLLRYAKQNDKKFLEISNDAESALCEYLWPGNVRELQNCIQQAVVLNNGETLELDMLPEGIRSSLKLQVSTSSQRQDDTSPDFTAGDGIVPIEVYEKQAIEHALRITKGKVAQAAAGLHLSQATLYRKVRDYEIVLKHYKKA